jgi:3-oxoacyl-[acyl-carrier-protein] synthase III
MSVFITRISKFLPNNPISNEEMESLLGLINDAPSRAKSLVLRNNKIKTRYYALDKSGTVTHNNAQLVKQAINNLFDKDFSLMDIDVLSCGTTSPDQLLPAHAAMVHGELGGKPVEINSATGACSAGIQALKFGYMSVLSGNANHAVCTGSERISVWMLAKYFQEEAEKVKQLESNPILAFEKDFLRFMLSDGAGAVLLEPTPAKSGLSLQIEWIEQRSFASELPVCMYAGAVMNGSGKTIGWSEMNQSDWTAKSVFALKQDTKLLGDNIVKKGAAYMKEISKKRNLDFTTIDYFLPHLSSQFFGSLIDKEFRETGIDIPLSKWFTNLSSVGNVGAGSPYIMLEELFHSGRLKKADRILMMIPESARFNYSGVLLTVV